MWKSRNVFFYEINDFVFVLNCIIKKTKVIV